MRLLPLTTLGLVLAGSLAQTLVAEDSVRQRLQTINQQAQSAYQQAETQFTQASNDAEREKARQAVDAASVISGKDNWLYTLGDVAHHANGRFWGDDAAQTAVASRHPDPLPALKDFAEQCRKAGVTLIVAPVPSKVRMHGAALDPALADWQDEVHDDYLRTLKAAQVPVWDLRPLMTEIRAQGHQVHLKGDSHWSPTVVEAVAAALHAKVAEEPWVQQLTPLPVEQNPRTTLVTGDLAQRLDGNQEELTINTVTLDGKAHAPDKTSPIVLMGDSHGLVYGHRDLLSVDAGLGDHLAAAFGIPIDVIAVMGSGANASRMTLARRRDQLAGKKLVIWIFAEREGSQSTSGWPLIPVVR